MFASFDFDVIRRSLGYLFIDGMTFTLTLTALAAVGGLALGDRLDARAHDLGKIRGLEHDEGDER